MGDPSDDDDAGGGGGGGAGGGVDRRLDSGGGGGGGGGASRVATGSFTSAATGIGFFDTGAPLALVTGTPGFEVQYVTLTRYIT